MSCDIPGETEFERVERLAREDRARWAREMAAWPDRRVPSAVAGQFSPQDVANGRGGR